MNLHFIFSIPTAILGFALLPAISAMALAPRPAAESPVKIRLSDNGDFMVPLLAQGLGYFQQEGLEMIRVKIADVAPTDFQMQEPLNKGRIDASFHWFQHTIFGVRHNYPVKAVIMLSDAPGLKIMVANRVKDQIKSAADFKGRNVAEGMGYAAKSMLTNYLAQKAGLPSRSYTSVFPETAGRFEAVTKGLNEGKVDIVSFMEPLSSAILATNKVSTLYDMTTREGTVKALGAPLPAISILMAPSYIEAHPEIVQRLVNVFVRTMRYINTHNADEIAAKLPATYFTSKDRQAEIDFLRNTLPNYARGDYSFTPDAVQMAIDTIRSSSFDKSEEGVWRATVENPHVIPEQLYTNEFVEKAMREIR
ncbi:MAG: ABC transporter substrate-binding protein [Opitutaceae bacterium]|nr:ABC transporter substrate-binding protein [Opitutaceae bacterium]